MLLYTYRISLAAKIPRLHVRFIAAQGGAEVKGPLDNILQTAPGEQRFGSRRGLGDGFDMGIITGARHKEPMKDGFYRILKNSSWNSGLPAYLGR
jgi:hypothetical protein